MKTCEGLAAYGAEVELWIPRRRNPQFPRDPFAHYGVARNFTLRVLPAFDGLAFFPGRFGFFVMVATFGASLIVSALLHKLTRRAIFYLHDPLYALFLQFVARHVFLEIHEIHEGYRKAGFWTRRFFSRVQGFIVTNRFKENMLHERLNIPHERMLIQQNVVDAALFRIDMPQGEARHTLGIPADVVMILYSGQLLAWKGIDTLLEAHAFLRENETIYFIGGTDEGIEKFKAQSEKLNAHKVVIVGRKPYREMPLWLRAADVLALCHSARFEIAKYEASPVKLFEYMASGRPIVVSNLPSLREIVNEEMVWFFEPDNPRSLADAIHRVIDRKGEAETKARRAREESARYTWEKRSERIVKFVRESLAISQ